jgi:uncharacterized RDD family membrane protein YckC
MDAAATAPANRTLDKVTIVDFSPERLRAPFQLRCAAIFVDYLLLVALPVGWLLLSNYFGDTGPGTGIGTTVWLVGIILFICNFLLLPLLRGQTFGKLLMGLTILNMDGSSIGLVTILRRHIVGYFLTVLTLGIGFLIAALNSTGRSLHDYVAGTVVVRARKTNIF